MGLSKEEQDQLDALTAKANEPDEDDFDIEIWDEKGAGAKVPYRKGKTWLQRFGIDLPETPEDDETQAPKKTPGKTTTGEASGGHAQRYFGNKRAS